MGVCVLLLKPGGCLIPLQCSALPDTSNDRPTSLHNSVRTGCRQYYEFLIRIHRLLSICRTLLVSPQHLAGSPCCVVVDHFPSHPLTCPHIPYVRCAALIDRCAPLGSPFPFTLLARRQCDALELAHIRLHQAFAPPCWGRNFERGRRLGSSSRLQACEPLREVP